jgi:hypothetical protein
MQEALRKATSQLHVLAQRRELEAHHSKQLAAQQAAASEEEAKTRRAEACAREEDAESLRRALREAKESLNRALKEADETGACEEEAACVLAVCLRESEGVLSTVGALSGALWRQQQAAALLRARVVDSDVQLQRLMREREQVQFTSCFT